jgi:protease I
MKAIILTADGVEDTELLYPYYRLQEADIAVDVAAPMRGNVTGKHAYTLEANLVFAEVDADAYDLLVIPGGRGPEIARLDVRAVAVARRMLESGKVVAAICHGSQVLISAGVLKGKRATCWKGIQDV